jgi:hypothetical protein
VLKIVALAAVLLKSAKRYEDLLEVMLVFGKIIGDCFIAKFK